VQFTKRSNAHLFPPFPPKPLIISKLIYLKSLTTSRLIYAVFRKCSPSWRDRLKFNGIRKILIKGIRSLKSIKIGSTM
jgi:hypothetical protein